jgi:hypothetical protein
MVRPNNGGFAASLKAQSRNETFSTALAGQIATQLVRNAYEPSEQARDFLRTFSDDIRNGKIDTINGMEWTLEARLEKSSLDLKDKTTISAAVEKTIGEFSQSATRHAGGGGGKRQHGG